MYYIGIDLGTTNSVIATFNGQETRVWKSKEQSDVTPSAIYVDRRGKKFYGKKAYDMAAKEPERAALLFKRFMGTQTPIEYAGISSTPEECSSEVLQQLFRNLPEEIRNSDDNGVVITVPAAFDQMQNAATVEAAKLANLGDHVTLIQEPVAAIMSVMKNNSKNGNFLIFDMGGGTLDIAIADSMNGKVNLLAHGGIAMCGGRDFDRQILNSKIIPWLMENYDLPGDFKVNEKYKTALQLAVRAAEEAKIDLSSDEEVTIDADLSIEDLDGEPIYLDIPFRREDLDAYIDSYVDDAIRAARETIHKAGLSPLDFDRIIFVGGPTNYKPLRDKVSRELGIESSLEVNPMTAVAEGAAIYAESIDWNSISYQRKSERGLIKSQQQLGLSFKYAARTTADEAKIIVRVNSDVEGYTFDIASIDTGWNSGNVMLVDRTKVSVPLNSRGENRFVITVYDAYGREIQLDNAQIVISKTIASVGAILASHSIGIEIQESLDSTTDRTLDYLVRENDQLPAHGTREFRAMEDIRAGTDDELRFNLWEGDIPKPVEDNLFIGCMTISGNDFDFGTIHKGDRLVCEYTITESGSIELQVSVPSIDEDFSGKNFYSRTQGEKDWGSEAENTAQEAKKVLQKLEDMAEVVKGKDAEIIETAVFHNQAILKKMKDNPDSEDIKKSAEELLQMKKTIYTVKQRNQVLLRQQEITNLKEFYAQEIKPYATGREAVEMEKQLHALEVSIGKSDTVYEHAMDRFMHLSVSKLFQNPRFLVSMFRDFSQLQYDFTTKDEARDLIEKGNFIIKNNGRVDDLARIVLQLRDLAPVEGERIIANITRY